MFLIVSSDAALCAVGTIGAKFERLIRCKGLLNGDTGLFGVQNGRFYRKKLNFLRCSVIKAVEFVTAFLRLAGFD
ncbi:hypothetical protein QM565_19030 [Geitlerinema splendidum]|nr:hypothetical protein [Geitlerinema splendidum]